MSEISCLDKGYVRLVSFMGDDLSVVRAARVSFDAQARTGEDAGKDEKLIHYLWKNKHTSPFEACTMTFEVKAPIFVFRQWHRHRTQSYNEVSARYTELPDEFYIPQPEHIGTQSKSSKQARAFTNDSDVNVYIDGIELYSAQAKSSFRIYKLLLADGWPRELARIVLPLSTYSHMFTTMNLLNCFKFLTLRLNPHAQYEIRVYAQAMLDLIRVKVPTCIEAWEAYK